MTFPATSLEAIGGSCYAHLFENRATGVRRGLFRSLTLDFGPVEFEDELWPSSATVEWLVLPGRDWRDARGFALKGGYGEGGVEASFYVSMHSLASRFEVAISDWRFDESQREGTTPVEFEVSMRMLIDSSPFARAPNPALDVVGAAWIEFEGLLVGPENLFPKPKSIREQKEALRPFIDPIYFAQPTSGSRFWRPV